MQFRPVRFDLLDRPYYHQDGVSAVAKTVVNFAAKKKKDEEHKNSCGVQPNNADSISRICLRAIFQQTTNLFERTVTNLHCRKETKLKHHSASLFQKMVLFLVQIPPAKIQDVDKILTELGSC